MGSAEGALQEPEPVLEQEAAAAAPRWSLARRIAFRFLFSYFLLFFLTGQEINHVPLIAVLAQKYTELWYAVAVWVGRHVFNVTYEFPLFGSGSGDTTFRWILLPCYVTLAGAATIVWSVLDRKRAEYRRLHEWFRLLLRFSLAVALIEIWTGARVPTYRGNRGNLLQHWLLVELVGLLWEEVRPSDKLCFFDAHAMSPFAVQGGHRVVWREPARTSLGCHALPSPDLSAPLQWRIVRSCGSWRPPSFLASFMTNSRMTTTALFN